MDRFQTLLQFQLAPLPGGCCGRALVREAADRAVGRGQGLTLVHFSAQLEPFLTQNTPFTPPNPPSHPLHTP